MAIDDLLDSVKRKVGAGVLGLGLVLGYGVGCGEEESRCESICEHLESCNGLAAGSTETIKFTKELCISECKTYTLDNCSQWVTCVYNTCNPRMLDDCEDLLCSYPG